MAKQKYSQTKYESNQSLVFIISHISVFYKLGSELLSRSVSGKIAQWSLYFTISNFQVMFHLLKLTADMEKLKQTLNVFRTLSNIYDGAFFQK